MIYTFKGGPYHGETKDVLGNEVMVHFSKGNKAYTGRYTLHEDGVARFDYHYLNEFSVSPYWE